MSIKPSGASSRAALWTGRILSVLVSLFMLMGAVQSIARTQTAIDGMKHYGYPEVVMVPLGIIVVISVVLYLFPRTTVLGAIMLTGYLGGAVDTHVHAGEFALVVTPVVVAAVVWLALVFREPRLRALLPWRS